MARAQGARAQMALAFETTYGTPPASGFTRMPFASTSLGAEQPLLNSELLGYGRDHLAPIKDAVTADGERHPTSGNGDCRASGGTARGKTRIVRVAGDPAGLGLGERECAKRRHGGFA